MVNLNFPDQKLDTVSMLTITQKIETEIEKFNPKEYWSINVIFSANDNQFNSRLTHFNGRKIEKLSIQNDFSATDILKNVLKIIQN